MNSSVCMSSLAPYRLSTVCIMPCSSIWAVSSWEWALLSLSCASRSWSLSSIASCILGAL
jgi:hypothetical protein